MRTFSRLALKITPHSAMVCGWLGCKGHLLFGVYVLDIGRLAVVYSLEESGVVVVAFIATAGAVVFGLLILVESVMAKF